MEICQRIAMPRQITTSESWLLNDATGLCSYVLSYFANHRIAQTRKWRHALINMKRHTKHWNNFWPTPNCKSNTHIQTKWSKSVSNFRPISLLPVVSIIVEKWTCNQLLTYFTNV